MRIWSYSYVGSDPWQLAGWVTSRHELILSPCLHHAYPYPILAYPFHLLGNFSDHAGPAAVGQQGTILSGWKLDEAISEVQPLGDQVPELYQVAAVRHVPLRIPLHERERRVLRNKKTSSGSNILLSIGRTIAGSITAQQIRTQLAPGADPEKLQEEGHESQWCPYLYPPPPPKKKKLNGFRPLYFGEARGVPDWCSC